MLALERRAIGGVAYRRVRPTDDAVLFGVFALAACLDLAPWTTDTEIVWVAESELLRVVANVSERDAQ